MRAAAVVLLLASAAAAQTEHVTAARQRERALSAVEFVLTVKGPKEAGTARLVYDGPKARVERVTPPSKQRDGQTFVAATDGERVKDYVLQQGERFLGSYHGGIHPGSGGVGRDTKLFPLTFAARGLTAVYCPFPADTLTPAGTADVRGRQCEQFAGGTATLWLDPAAGHTLRRFKQGGTTVDVDSSDANPAKVWLPTAYTVATTDATGRVEKHEYAVERVEAGRRYPESEFDPPWPAGVWVYDALTGRHYVSDDTGTLQPAHTTDVMWDGFARLWWVPVAVVALGAGLLGWRLWKARK